MRFLDKDQAIYAVRKWSIQMSREFKVVKSKSNQWTAKCANSTDQQFCSWYIHIIKKATHGQWQITVYRPEHTCPVRILVNSHRKMPARHIASDIVHLIQSDPQTRVSRIVTEIQMKFQSLVCWKACN